ncbi:SgrR family transcriptional regulator [Vibrio marisflavi]|uniref:HTH-type transcriptional regulator SgrR n=1 Tax=Vibrio marisflavi CECT 7928 TaxID=634439 RepID=A0ABN8E460_9VIBR|nr:SgrR family transcriptional regulator [Vibrio marisflavi]CAH0540254.1 HTH-type transcriptional regulator SgrR [Vibrio marisflavi CECT 7928]
MHRPQLESQYIKLLNLFGNHQQKTTLSQISSALFCSTRHARNIIKDMQNRGWLLWSSQHGRGKKSTLKLFFNDFEFNELCVKSRVEQGRQAEAYSLIHQDEKSLEQFISRRFGYEVRNDKRVLRVPYYRSMPNLEPCSALRRSEMHLVRQVFNGLTAYNEEKQEVIGDIAFYWKQIDDLTWKFYLRPGVYFHNGKILDSADVVWSLKRCKDSSNVFDHLVEIKASDSLSVTIRLNQCDRKLPLLLSDISAMILPNKRAGISEFSSYPVGTGAFRVKANDEYHLQLQAFDRYFGFRSLIDEVDIVTIPYTQSHSTPISTDYFSQPGKKILSGWVDNSTINDDTSAFKETLIEQGAYFLIYDSRQPEFENPAIRNWFNEALQDCYLLSQLPLHERPYWMPAKSFMPDYWHTSVNSDRTGPTNDSFVLAYCTDHPEYQMFSEAIQHLLAQHNIRLTLKEIEYAQWSAGEVYADIWLGSVMIPEPRLWCCCKWLFDTPVVRCSLTGTDKNLLDQLQIKWVSGQISDEEVISQSLALGWVRPLFHHWLKLNCSTKAKGVKLNSLGWFDFKSIWLAED